MALSGFNHSVQWNEFRTVDRRPGGVPEDAHMTSGASTFQPIPARITGTQNCRVASAKCVIAVIRSGTWVVRGRQSADLLRHEQGHYEITALGTRNLYNQVLRLTAPCRSLNREVQSLQRQTNTLIAQTNIRYDLQTNHGNNATVQRTWDARIRSAMQSANGTLADLPQ